MRLLIGRKLPAVIIRMLLNMYLLHVTSVAWNGSHSLSFRVWNGVRQGAIISPILFCVYFDVLLCQLCSQDIGCHIGSLFVGTLAYADDLVLIAPSAHAMRLMLKVCDDYATQYSVIFNASKSKCLHCLPPGTSERSPLPQPFYIGSRAIEFVDKWPHLGHTLTNKNDDAEDILSRRLSFIEQVNKVIRYHVALDDIVTFAFGSDDIDERVVLSSDDKAKADWLIELLQCRDNLLQLSNSDFNAHDINSMITLLCTQ
jgi:hypothetical protein